MSDTVEVEELVPRRGSSSVIWKYFGFRASDTNQQKTMCKVCRRVVAASQANTTHFFSHLKGHHRIEYEDCMKARSVASAANVNCPGPSSAVAQTSIKASMYSATPYASKSRHTEITDAITFHLAKDMCPINTVSNEGFEKMINILDKKDVIPSRN